LREDPDALSRIGLKVGRNQDGTLRVYQPPGERNALGRIRFNFPNKFLVYQHDTPNKELFAKNERAFSHGCMRVQNPEKYAEVLTSISQPTEGFTADRIRGLFGRGERNIILENPIPVHVTYQTAFVDSIGTLQIRPDIYGRDAQTLKLLRNERRSGEAPLARNENSNSGRKNINTGQIIHLDGDSRKVD
jgi:L,D-transpeptidase YcbB